MKQGTLVFLIVISMVIGVFIGKPLWQAIYSPNRSQLRHDVTMLQQVKDMLTDAYVPDSVKQETRDASYTSMYAEPDGNDYWSARGKIHETEALIKTCAPCMYIDSILQVKDSLLTQLNQWGITKKWFWGSEIRSLVIISNFIHCNSPWILVENSYPVYEHNNICLFFI